MTYILMLLTVQWRVNEKSLMTINKNGALFRLGGKRGVVMLLLTKIVRFW